VFLKNISFTRYKMCERQTPSTKRLKKQLSVKAPQITLGWRMRRNWHAMSRRFTVCPLYGTHAGRFLPVLNSVPRVKVLSLVAIRRKSVVALVWAKLADQQQEAEKRFVNVQPLPLKPVCSVSVAVFSPSYLGVLNLFTTSYHLRTPYCQCVPLHPEQLIWSNLCSFRRRICIKKKTKTTTTKFNEIFVFAYLPPIGRWVA